MEGEPAHDYTIGKRLIRNSLFEREAFVSRQKSVTVLLEIFPIILTEFWFRLNVVQVDDTSIFRKLESQQ